MLIPFGRCCQINMTEHFVLFNVKRYNWFIQLENTDIGLCTSQLKPRSPPPVRGSTRDSGGNVPFFYIPDCPAVRGECCGFVFAPNIAGIRVYTGVRVHLAGNLPAACPRRAGIVPGIG